jgi:hypothetical protein
MPVIGDELNFGTDLVRSLEAFRDSEVHWVVWEFCTSREVTIHCNCVLKNQMFSFMLLRSNATIILCTPTSESAREHKCFIRYSHILCSLNFHVRSAQN